MRAFAEFQSWWLMVGTLTCSQLSGDFCYCWDIYPISIYFLLYPNSSNGFICTLFIIELCVKHLKIFFIQPVDGDGIIISNFAFQARLDGGFAFVLSCWCQFFSHLICWGQNQSTTQRFDTQGYCVPLNGHSTLSALHGSCPGPRLVPSLGSGHMIWCWLSVYGLPWFLCLPGQEALGFV